VNASWFLDYLTYVWLLLALVTFPILFLVAAPYGRHSRAGWGPTVDNSLGWMLMEAPAVLVFAACFLGSDEARTVPALTFFVMWEAHYVYRAFGYPWRLKDRGRRMPAVIVCLATLFNVGNGYVNGRHVFGLAGGYPNDWLTDARFILGLVLFLAGYGVNRHSDRMLRDLREPGETGYRIPFGGFYRWISCPNYLGEIVEWVGWAVATWSLPGLAFAVWTAANLVPRAWANHRWYRERFPNYPADRRALLPGLW
jgi:protein-S-isoprenylcysteine O-methyltransferase Ste14